MLPTLLSVLALAPLPDALGLTTGGDLYRINTALDTKQLVGNCGFSGIFAMASAEDGALWTIAGVAPNPVRLISIDRTTGDGTLAATLPISGSVRGMAFDVDGSLKLVVRANNALVDDTLMRLDMTNFSLSTIGSTTIRGIEGLCMTPEGKLYAWDASSNGASGLGLVQVGSNGVASDVSGQTGDSQILSLGINAFGEIAGLGRQVFNVDRISGAKTAVTADLGLDFVGLEFVNAMTPFNGALAIESDGTVSRVNSLTGATRVIGSAGSFGFLGIASRSNSLEFWAARSGGPLTEFWRIDPRNGAGTFVFSAPIAGLRDLYSLTSGVLEAVTEGGGANPDQLLQINTVSQTVTTPGTIAAQRTIEAACANPLNFRIAWDSQVGLVHLLAGGQDIVLTPGSGAGTPLTALAHDPFGRLFGVGDRLYRINVPTGARTPIGSTNFPDFVGMTFFRTFAFPQVQNYCTAQTTSLGCTPQISNLFSFNSPSLSAGAGFNLRVSGLPLNKPGLFFYGVNGRAASPFLGGFLCVQPPLRRTPLRTTSNSGAACAGSMTMDFNAHVVSNFDPALEVGTTVGVQAWTRDPGATSTTNLSAALEFVMCP
ncbi:MAG: hypothetical protein JNN27_20750 [Planctomycetes bacterium]|nr:hypothetical protein [Planctomycetota bacterium]